MAERVTEQQRQRFQRAIWPLVPTVLRFAQFLTREEHEAEDLAQETLMRALRSIDSFEDGTDAKAWLFTIARRIHIDRARVKKNQPLASLDAAGAPEPAAPPETAPAGIHDEAWSEPEDLLRRFEDREVVEALRQLPDEIRWTLLLVDVEGMDHADAARLLDVPTGTIKSRAHRGRGMLRDRLFARAQARGWVAGAGGGAR